MFSAVMFYYSDRMRRVDEKRQMCHFCTPFDLGCPPGFIPLYGMSPGQPGCPPGLLCCSYHH